MLAIFMGCPCHLVHNIAGHASEAFQESSGFDVEDLCIDVYYWLDKSTKRKGSLKEFCDFRDSEYRKILATMNIRSFTKLLGHSMWMQLTRH